jgi:hypothetical protein
MDDDEFLESLLLALATGNGIAEAEEYYNNIVQSNPVHMVELLFAAISDSSPSRVSALILLGHTFSSLGSQSHEIPDPVFHLSVAATLLTHFQSPHFSTDERRHLSYVTSLASMIYSDWPNFVPFLLALSVDSNPEIASSALDCFALCIENRSRELPSGGVLFPIFQRLFSAPHPSSAAASLRLLYAAFHNSSECQSFVSSIVPIVMDFIASPSGHTLMANLCTFLETFSDIPESLATAIIRPMMDVVGERTLSDGTRTSAFYVLDLVLEKNAELFAEDNLGIALFDLCVALFSDLPAAGDTLARAATVFGGTVEYALHTIE